MQKNASESLKYSNILKCVTQVSGKTVCMLGQDSKIAEFILLNLLNQRKFCIQLFSQDYIYLVQEFKNCQFF